MTDKSIILSLLLKNQKQNISLDKKLSYNDLYRISNNISKNIFMDECCIWNGSIINNNSNKKNCYISFFFKNKKVSLHRLLYINYIDNLNDNEYIKYTCENKGKCCSINHLTKVIKGTIDSTIDGTIDTVNINTNLNKLHINNNIISF